MKENAAAKQTKVKAPVRLSGGNPKIAKADGDAPVQAYIAAMPGWKSAIGKRIDSLITSNVPGVTKAVKWNSPFYIANGKDWFLAFHVFTRYAKVTFFRGTTLHPPPPGHPERTKEAPRTAIHAGDHLAEIQFSAWIRQAAAQPGWDLSRSS